MHPMEKIDGTEEYKTISGTVHLPLILESAGIDPNATEEYVVKTVLPASFTIFSYGEYVFPYYPRVCI